LIYQVNDIENYDKQKGNEENSYPMIRYSYQQLNGWPFELGCDHLLIIPGYLFKVLPRKYKKRIGIHQLNNMQKVESFDIWIRLFYCFLHMRPTIF